MEVTKCSSRPAQHFNWIASEDGSRLDNRAIDTAQAQVFAFGSIDEIQGSLSEAGGELGAASMRDRGYLNNRFPDLQARARWEVGEAQVKINKKLIAGQRPTRGGTREHAHHAGIHQGYLAARVGGMAEFAPNIPYQTISWIQPASFEQLARIQSRPAYNQLQSARITGRGLETIPIGFDFRQSQNIFRFHLDPFIFRQEQSYYSILYG